MRTSPAEKSEALVTLRERIVHDSRVHQLRHTGELSGRWGRFEVIEFNSDFDESASESDTTPKGNRWQGWLRLVNEQGLPEFWFFTGD